MGHMIERVALGRGHEIVERVDAGLGLAGRIGSAAFGLADVAIEFSTPASAVDNYRACFAAGKPVVSGTTGWLDREGEVRDLVRTGGHTMFYSSNFSLGVNLFMELNRHLAELMRPFGEYTPSLEETHHTHKLDAPSGTALTLAGDLQRSLACPDRVGGSQLVAVRWPDGQHPDRAEAPESGKLHMTAIRQGEVPGTHTIRWTSPVDELAITHRAFGREGFALGVVLAAEFTKGRKGWFTMKDLLGF